MKNYNESIGIDVSKLTLDAYSFKSKKHQQFTNDSKGFAKLLSWIKNQGNKLNEVIVCFENTGWYSLNLSIYLNESSIDFIRVNPLELKRSIGLKRGKSDKADAQDIAKYSWQNKEDIKLSVAPSKKLIELQRLLALREQLVKQQTALKNQYEGMKSIVNDVTMDKCMQFIVETLVHLAIQIKKVEQEMDLLIKQDEQLQKNYKLCKSVKGIGQVLAIQMILHTQNFTSFDCWRKFSAYCGLVPYPYQSGTSIHGKNRIHPISDRKMKSLLSMASISAIRADKELKAYYQRRVEEGKPKKSVINMVRNKIVARVFATVNRGTPFVELHRFAA